MATEKPLQVQRDYSTNYFNVVRSSTRKPGNDARHSGPAWGQNGLTRLQLTSPPDGFGDTSRPGQPKS